MDRSDLETLANDGAYLKILDLFSDGCGVVVRKVMPEGARWRPGEREKFEATLALADMLGKVCAEAKRRLKEERTEGQTPKPQSKREDDGRPT